ncbi:MAG: hypothetical protein L3K07_00575 [Thermoplasmata archaeon]|nr:hypothetical protein [Thermoplasmata archaeon]
MDAPNSADTREPSPPVEPRVLAFGRQLLALARRAARRAGGWLQTREGRVFLGFAAVATFITLVNFRGLFTVHFIDNSWPQDPSGQLRSLVYAWGPDRLGYLNLLGPIAIPSTTFAAGLQLLGAPSGVQEILLLVLLLTVALYFTYRLLARYVLRQVEPELRQLLAVVGALLLVTSFYVQTVYWWDFLPDGFLLLAAGSVLLYYATAALSDVLGQHPQPRGRLVLLAVASTLAFSVNIPFNLSLLFLVFTLPALAVIAAGRAKFRVGPWLRFEVLLAALVALTSLWWLLPSAEFATIAPAYVTTQSVAIDSHAIFVSSTSGIDLVGLLEGQLGYPLYNAGHFGLTSAIHADLGVPLSVLFLGVLAGGLLLWKRREHLALTLATGLMLFLALFVTGVNSPFYPVVFGFLFQSPLLLTSLRTPFVAFGLAFEEFWVCAMCLGASSCYGWLRGQLDRPVGEVAASPPTHRSIRALRSRAPRLLGPVLIGLLLLVPAATLAPGAWAGDAVPVAPYQARMEVAPYEASVASFLRGHLDGRVAMLYPGGFLEQNWTHGYDGYDVLPSLLPGELLIDNYREGFVATNNSLLTLAYSTLDNGNPRSAGFGTLLARLGVAYLVVEGDVGGNFPFGQSTPPNYAALLGSLNASVNLSLAATFGPDYVYGVASPRGLVSLVDSTVSEAGLVQAEVQPSLDLTRAYFNATRIVTTSVPFPPVAARWQNGINFTAAPGDKIRIAASDAEQAPPLPGPITLVNGYPLDLNVSAGDTLLLNFSTNAATAISVSLIVAPTLTGLPLGSVYAATYSVGAPADNLGTGDAALVPAYGANHFVSPGHFTLLSDDLAATLRGVSNPTIHFLAITLWPVNPDGSGNRGAPVAAWPGSQSVQISSLELGTNLFLGPALLPADPFAGGWASGTSPVDLLPAVTVGLRTNSSLAPPHTLFETGVNGSVGMVFGPSAKSNWSSHPLGPPFAPYGPPTYFSANSLGVNVSRTPFLTLNLTSARDTAFAVAVVPDRNLSSLSSSSFARDTFFLGGVGSTAGEGDPLLTPTYGTRHYDSNGSWLRFTEVLSTLLPGASPFVNHLLFELFYVSPNGSGVRGLSPEAWPGTQTLLLGSAEASPYLVDGSPPTGPLPSLMGIPFAAAVPGGLPLDAASLAGPPASFDRNVSLTYSYPSPTNFKVRLSTTDPSSPKLEVLVELAQTYFGGWQLENLHGIVSWSQVRLDGALDGFLVELAPGAVTASFDITFLPQTLYTVSLVLGLLVPASIGVYQWLVPLVRRRLR